MRNLWRRGKALSQDPLREDLILGVGIGLLGAIVWAIVANPAHILLYLSWGIVVGVVYVGPILVWITRRSARRHQGAAPPAPPRFDRRHPRIG
ncbi:MAG: hypothetical protein JWL73_3750 [Actinomycetia bacterium]|nr:hypothetical protein [Actinomycetes bacterium]